MKLLIALAIALAPASDGISAFAGGRVKSPDGAWSVWAAATNEDANEVAVARLNGPGVKNRELMRFARSIDVVWPSEPGRVMLVQRTEHFATLYVFTLGAAETGSDWLQSDIERAMAARWPRLASIENRRIAFGRQGGATCVLVEETGLPAGRAAGSVDARRGAFRLDLAAKRAMPVRGCLGARIDAAAAER
ncbi:hypothetical protein AB2M62_09370 [Sphingomonas sp. MMS12-HWE2-04]|uniref:hypothetical protein n=1 Tax=Sphingomonas sp. MMS12-HWE2-04 TaxID=3234199 RepID=UPI00384B18EB